MPPLSHLTFSTPTNSNLYVANSLVVVASEPDPYRLHTFHVPNLMSLFHCLRCTTGSIRVREKCIRFVTRLSFWDEELLAPRSTPMLRDNPCRQSETAYSKYSQLPSILEAVPPSATWRRAMARWHGSTYHGTFIYTQCKHKYTFRNREVEFLF